VADEDYVIDGFVSPTEVGESKGEEAVAGAQDGAPGAGTGAAAAAPAGDDAGEAPLKDAVSVRVRLPSGKEVPLMLGLGDHAGIIRQYLSEMLEVCCETSYDLHVRNTTPGCGPSVLAGFVPLAEYGLQDNDVIRMVRVPYDMRTAQAHVRRLRDVLQSPPYPQALVTPPEQGACVSRTRLIARSIFYLFSQFAFLGRLCHGAPLACLVPVCRPLARVLVAQSAIAECVLVGAAIVAVWPSLAAARFAVPAGPMS
jgi:hypothetical protein